MVKSARCIDDESRVGNQWQSLVYKKMGHHNAEPSEIEHMVDIQALLPTMADHSRPPLSTTTGNGKNVINFAGKTVRGAAWEIEKSWEEGVPLDAQPSRGHPLAR